jgi:hypothetical protein
MFSDKPDATLEDTYWQPQWNDMVCYVAAVKCSPSLDKL